MSRRSGHRGFDERRPEGLRQGSPLNEAISAAMVELYARFYGHDLGDLGAALLSEPALVALIAL